MELNPGPVYKYPCGTCEKPVKSNQMGLLCSGCSNWFHIKCQDVLPTKYARLFDLPDEPWICLTCALPQLSDSYFDSTLSDGSVVDPDSTSSPLTGIFDNTATKAIFGANINARSVKNKIPELQAVVHSMNLSLVAITETWLDSSIPDSMLFDSHYCL